MKKILFICAANVGRSQMAEGYYNHYTKSNLATSAALVEDRREKFGYKPENTIQEVMQKDWVDISSQRIKLLTNNLCKEANKIVLLFDPYTNGSTSEFTINGMNAIDFLQNKYAKKIIMVAIDDPSWKDKKEAIKIRNRIRSIVKKLLK